MMCIGRLHMILFLKMWVAESAAGGNTIPNSTPDLCSCKFILLICLFVLAHTGQTLESIFFYCKEGFHWSVCPFQTAV